MASPAAAGVAAIIRGYFPELTAKEVKEVLMKTSIQYTKKVRIPGTKKQKAKLSDLCISGGLINAENAVKYLLAGKK
jgi:subtilisin family serine protease